MTKAPPRRRRIFPRTWIRPMALAGAAIVTAGGIAGGLWLKGDELHSRTLAATAAAQPYGGREGVSMPSAGTGGGR